MHSCLNLACSFRSLRSHWVSVLCPDVKPERSPACLDPVLTLQEGYQGPVDIVGSYKSQGIDVALGVACSQQIPADSGRIGEDLTGDSFLRKASASEAPIVYVGGHQVFAYFIRSCPGLSLG